MEGWKDGRGRDVVSLFCDISGWIWNMGERDEG